MLVPDIKTLNSSNREKIDTNKIILEDVPEPIYYDYELNIDDKKRDSFIKKVERIVRFSYEYKKYVRYLRDELKLNKCSFLTQIDLDEIKGVGLELHHYPFSLYDIVSIVINDKFAKGQLEICPFEIANEVTGLHFENIIGLIPLSKTAHELAHSGELFIDPNEVYGNVKQFINRYDKGISSDLVEKINKLIDIAESMRDYSPEILRRIITTIEQRDYRDIEKIELKEEKQKETA